MNSSSMQNAEKLLKKYSDGERDFSNITLNECSLSGAKLPHIILQRASLKVVNLSNANLSHSNLQQAVLNVSRLSGANLSQANLQRAQINVSNLIQAVLVGANLAGASLIRAELLRADLSNANLIQANLQEADLREARLRWARLRRANLSQCSLRDSNLAGADLSSAQLYSASMEGANLSGALLFEAELRHVNLRSANLSGANLRGANLRWADLSGANLQEADLTEAKLSGANLMGAQLNGVILENTTLVHADLSRANLQNMHCVNSDFSGATLTGALMHGMSCYDLQTTETVCEWIDLSPAGDRSQIRRFKSAAEVRRFLNHRPPQVQIVIDFALNHTANRVLAKIYERIGANLGIFNRPPNITISHRRTSLTFVVGAEAVLLAIASIASWPFQDGAVIGKNLAELTSQGLDRPHSLQTQDEIYRHLNEALRALEDEDLQALKQKLRKYTFFTSALQLTLTNANGQTLKLYHNPRFGLRNLPPTDEIAPLQPSQAPLLQLDELLTFISPDET